MNAADVGILTADNQISEISGKNLMAVGRHLEGRVLTLIEASTVDEKQCEAVKSLARSAIWETLEKVGRWMIDNPVGTHNSSMFPF